jgi:hypothetical protein
MIKNITMKIEKICYVCDSCEKLLLEYDKRNNGLPHGVIRVSESDKRSGICDKDKLFCNKDCFYTFYKLNK